MRRTALFPLMALLLAACQDVVQPVAENAPPGDVGASASEGDGDVVLVAAPTGDRDTDRASIKAAIAQAEEGDIIQFAAGTYLIGAPFSFTPGPDEIIEVGVPRVTLLGHPDRTTLRGGDITGFGDLEGLLLTGGRQTVRNLTFESFSIAALVLIAPNDETGGYVVEYSTFRNNIFSVQGLGESDDVSHIRHNTFINGLIPFLVLGKTFNVSSNLITAPDPASVPLLGQPFNAGIWSADPDLGPVCENNEIEDNTVIGNADGFIIFSCGDTRIRDNTFIDQRIFSLGDNATMVWLIFSGEGNLIKNNELVGSEGIAIVLEGTSGNEIVDNEISDLPGVSPILPFSAVVGSALPGTGVFLDELTSLNLVEDNEFENVLNPIVDRGTDNILEDNEVDDDGDGGPYTAQAARTPSLTTAASTQQNAKIELLRRLRRDAK